jgi:PqqD family protein of HPr-rel-A system
VRFRCAAAVETSTAGDRVVLYHRRSGHALVLNPTGSWIWGLLAEPTSLTALASELTRHYPDVSSEQAERDLAALLAELQAHDMIESQP